MKPGALTWPAAAAAATLAACIAAGSPGPRDATGDPLPAGAAARFGSIRLHHGARIKCLAFSPNGRLLASCGGEYNRPGDVSVWDVASGRLVRSLPGPVQGLGAVAFSPDGKTLAAAGMDRIVRFWDVATGKPDAGFTPDPLGGTALTFSPDGRTVAASDGSNVYVADARSGKRRHTVRRASYCAFSPDGRHLAVASARDMTIGVQLREAATGRLVRRFAGNRQRFISPAFSPDGRLIAAGCTYGTDRGTIMVWETSSGKRVGKLTGHGRYVVWVAFHPRGGALASASRTDGIRIWDVEKSKVVRALAVVGGLFYAGAFSPDGKLLAAGGASGQIRVWQTATWAERHGEKSHRGPVVAAAASADGRRVLTGGQDGTARLWDGRTGEPLHRLAGEEKRISAVAVSPDGRTLAACEAGETVRIWDAATGRLRHRVRTPSHISLWATFLPGAERLITMGPSGAASEIDTATGKVRLLYAGAHSGLVHAALSADGRLAVASDRRLLYAWRLRTGERLGVFGAEGTAYFYAVAIDPTGRLLAGDTGRTAVLIELDSGKVVRQIAAARPRAGLGTVAFSHDGRLFASGEADGRIVIWDVRAGEHLAERTGHRGPVTTLAFLPNGRRLLSGSADGTAILWSVAGIQPSSAPAAAEPDANGLEELWRKLASTDATEAQETVFRLIDAGGPAAAFLGKRLEPAAGAPTEEIRRLVAELGHQRFAVRKRATEELARLGPVAEPALREAWSQAHSEELRARARQLLEALDDPHRRSGEAVRQLRAVHVLERIASEEAKGILRRLSSGSPKANLTRRAVVALQRLKQPRR